MGQASTILTFPILTRILGPAEYGVLEVMAVIWVFVSLATRAGIDAGMHREFFDHKDLSGQREVVSTSILLTTIAVAIVSSIGIILARPIASLFLEDAGQQDLVRAAAISLPFSVLASLTLEPLKLQRRPWAFLTSSVVAAFAGAFAVIWLVAGFSAGLKGVYLGLGIGACLSLAYNLYASRSLLGLVFRPSLIRRMLSFGLPLLPAGLAIWAINLIDRFILTLFVPFQDIGLYAAANRVASVFLLAFSGFSYSWSPIMLGEHATDPDSERHLRARMLTYMSAILATCAAFIAALSPELIQILAGNRFARAFSAVPVLTLALLFYGTTVVTGSAMAIKRRTGVFMITNLLAAGLNVVLCLVLIPVWGIHGAAAATAVAYCFLAVSYYRSAQSLDPAPFDLRSVITIFGALVPFLALAWVQLDPLWLSVGVKAVLVGLFPVILIGVGAIERSLLQRFIGSVFREVRGGRAAP